MRQGSNARGVEENCMLISVIRCLLQPQQRLMIDPNKIIGEGAGDNKGVSKDFAKSLL